jgi:hypothetical protein
VSNRGGEGGRQKVGVIDKRACAVSTGGGWLRYPGRGHWRVKETANEGGEERGDKRFIITAGGV